MTCRRVTWHATQQQGCRLRSCANTHTYTYEQCYVTHLLLVQALVNPAGDTGGRVEDRVELITARLDLSKYREPHCVQPAVVTEIEKDLWTVEKSIRVNNACRAGVHDKGGLKLKALPVIDPCCMVLHDEGTDGPESIGSPARRRRM